MRYVQPSEYRKFAKDPPAGTGVKLLSIAEPEIIGDSRTFRFCFSDSGVDLQGDRLNAEGWDTRNFRKNPVVLFSHDATQPIGKASNLQIKDGRLLGDITFAETALADEIFQLVKGGFVKAVSVGFMPKEYRFSDDPDRAGGIDYASMSLLEVSVCSIPCNPRALIEANEKGISTLELETWMKTRIEDKATSEQDRMVFKSLVNKEMEETDPSSGGDVVGNCGRDKDEECGMNNPQECLVHCDEYEDEGKALMAMTNILKQARAEIRRLNAELRRKAENENDESGETGPDEAEVHLAKAEAHRKAAEELHDAAVDHMEKCHKCFKMAHKCLKAMDGDEEEDREEDRSEDEGEDDDEAIEKIKARAVARLSR